MNNISQRRCRPLDLSRDVFPFRPPDVTLRLRVAEGQEFIDGLDEFPHATKTSLPYTVRRQIRKEPLHPIHPGASRGREMHYHPGMTFQPLTHPCVFVRRTVIHDQMELEVLGGLPLDLLQETQPLDMRGPGFCPGQDLPVQVV